MLSPRVQARLRIVAWSVVSLAGSLAIVALVVISGLGGRGLGGALMGAACCGFAFAPFLGAAALFDAIRLHRQDLRARRDTHTPETF